VVHLATQLAHCIGALFEDNAKVKGLGSRAWFLLPVCCLPEEI
jgi:hypothetical protein